MNAFGRFSNTREQTGEVWGKFLGPCMVISLGPRREGGSTGQPQNEVENCACQDVACLQTSFEMLCMGTNVFQGSYNVWRAVLSGLACSDLCERFLASAK